MKFYAIKQYVKYQFQDLTEKSRYGICRSKEARGSKKSLIFLKSVGLWPRQLLIVPAMRLRLRTRLRTPCFGWGWTQGYPSQAPHLPLPSPGWWGGPSASGSGCPRRGPCGWCGWNCWGRRSVSTGDQGSWDTKNSNFMSIGRYMSRASIQGTE